MRHRHVAHPQRKQTRRQLTHRHGIALLLAVTVLLLMIPRVLDRTSRLYPPRVVLFAPAITLGVALVWAAFVLLSRGARSSSASGKARKV